MTTIIVKNADYSAGKIRHYSPPVEGASLIAFVGDEDESTSLRNFGSGADLEVGLGAPAYQGGGFRQFDPNSDWMTAPGVYLTDATSIITVAKPTLGAGWQFVISSEREYSDSGRRGVTATYVAYNSNRLAFSSFGTNDDGTDYNKADALLGEVDDDSPSLCIGQFDNLTGNRLAINAYRMTPTTGNSENSNTHPNDTAGPTPDEADYPFRIGSTYLAKNYPPVEIGFVAVFPFLLTESQRQAMYTSIQRRFASLGVTI